MGQLDDVLNNAQGWKPNMAAPLSFTTKQRAEYQQRIDGIVGTRNGLSIIKLAWAPEELRWWPHRLGQEEPRGYQLPIFYYGNDHEGQKVAAPRWVLLELVLPEQYASSWEGARYMHWEGTTWDLSGPMPDHRYLELRAHCYHDGHCCPCHGAECVCGPDYAHCWGNYLDPNERLLDWIREAAFKARQDPDVDPTCDAQSFEAPNAQREAVAAARKRQEIQDERQAELWQSAVDHLERQPVSISTEGLKRTASGIYLLE